MDITQEKLKELLHYCEVTGVFTRKVKTCNRIKVGEVAGGIDTLGYRRIMVGRNSYFAHRLAWLYINGSFPKHQIDHINGRKDDNSIINLRSVTNSENCKNRRLQKKQ